MTLLSLVVVQSSTNLKAAAEYIILLFSEVREQQEGGFQEFEKLYFEMKDANCFIEKKDEEKMCQLSQIKEGYSVPLKEQR